MPKKRPNLRTGQWRRMLEIRRLLCSSHPRKVTAESLAGRFECSERTIRRDIECMRDQFGQELQYDPIQRTWFYAKPSAEMPATLVNTADRFALLVAQQAVEQFAATPWYEHLKGALARMIEMLPVELSTNYEKVARHIRFEGAPIAPISPDVWMTICRCIESSETLTMTYKTGRSGEVRQRQVDPYGLVVRNREWFLVGWDHFRRAVRTFFLPRIQSIDYTDKRFKVKDGFDLDEYLATSIDSHQSTGPIYHVKLRFTRAATAAGEDFIWNCGQKMHKDREGRVIVEFDTGALYAVERQVLAWGGGVEVMGPEELRRGVAELGRRVAEVHRSDGVSAETAQETIWPA